MRGVPLEGLLPQGHSLLLLACDPSQSLAPEAQGPPLLAPAAQLPRAHHCCLPAPHALLPAMITTRLQLLSSIIHKLNAISNSPHRLAPNPPPRTHTRQASSSTAGGLLRPSVWEKGRFFYYLVIIDPRSQRHSIFCRNQCAHPGSISSSSAAISAFPRFLSLSQHPSRKTAQ